MTPCRVCAMLIIQCGIKKVYAYKKYQKAEASIEMLKQAGVEIQHLYDEVESYK